jgi:hypothetical protein
MQILHWNDNPRDNRLENLRYGTASENRHDAVRNGKHPSVGQAACLRGHLLSAPNLVPASLKKGRRQCLACNRGQTTVNYAARCGRVLDLKQVADSKYAAIMSGTRNETGAGIHYAPLTYRGEAPYGRPHQPFAPWSC